MINPEVNELEVSVNYMLVQDGITDRQVKELIHHSNTDELVRLSTSDGKRFKDRKAYDEWRKKGRKIYTMTDDGGSLLGIIWYGNEPIPSSRDYFVSIDPNKYGITFAIRIYGNARGKGSAWEFMRDAWERYKSTPQFLENQSNGVWLETNYDNLPAVSAYKGFGYQQVSAPDSHGRIIMILS